MEDTIQQDDSILMSFVIILNLASVMLLIGVLDVKAELSETCWFSPMLFPTQLWGHCLQYPFNP